MNARARRIALTLTAICLLVPAIGRAAAPDKGAHDWPQFLGPTRNGVYAGDDVGPWKKAGPTVVWRREVGQGFAAPVVSDGRLVLFHRVADRETVECLDAATGKRKWLADYPTAYVDDFGFDEGPRATPAIADGLVYTFGAAGALACWELDSGRKRWGVDLKESLKSEKGFFGRACSPLVEGEAVILNVGGGPGAGVAAFDRKTGKVLWKATDDEAGYSSPVAATIGGRRYLFAFTRAGLEGLAPANGEQLFFFPWRSKFNASVNAASPVVVGDEVFISASYGTGSALLKIGTPPPADPSGKPAVKTVWSSDQAISSHYATPVYHDGFLFGYHGRQEQGPELRCIEWATGKTRWTQPDFGAGTVLVAGKTLVILTERGELILAPASPDGYKPICQSTILGGECRAYPALADGRLYARSKTQLVCLDLHPAGAKAP